MQKYKVKPGLKIDSDPFSGVCNRINKEARVISCACSGRKCRTGEEVLGRTDGKYKLK